MFYYKYEPRNGRIVTLGEWGQQKWTYIGHPRFNSEDNKFTPHDIVTTMHGHILIADRDSSTIHVVSKDGEFITDFSHEDIVHPVSLNIDKMGRLLIGCSNQIELTRIYDVRRKSLNALKQQIENSLPYFERKATEFRGLDLKLLSQHRQKKISDRQNDLNTPLSNDAVKLLRKLDSFWNPKNNAVTQQKEKLETIVEDLKQRRGDLEDALKESSPYFIFSVYEKINKDLPSQMFDQVKTPNLIYIESSSSDSYFGVSQTDFTSISKEKLQPCGVHSTKDTILVGYCSSYHRNEKSGIIILDSIGKEIRRFECNARNEGRLFTFPAKIATNINNDICIIDYKSFYSEKNPRYGKRYTYEPRNGRVVTLGVWGQPKWAYSGQSLVNCYDTFTPLDIVTTMHGHILIANRDSNTIHVVSKNGQFVTKFCHDDIVHPDSLNIDKMGRLLIGCSSDWDGGKHEDDAERCQTSKLHVVEFV
ncbi:unnamed protein product [Mytilus coruscus]|uniref:Uncharacterized protein n=1 Tax=Mytilus coruscus TaxID=42192 RepID=A0A6J8AFA5_MYTCO|nr:unnamed protein product [Mytilus coruscus]